MLSKRQLDILQLIIRLYAKQQEPVGSKTLLKEAALTCSSATIRNEMMKLEELGFLEKTHSSSGRVPSVQGYRFYVDNMLPTVQSFGIQPEELEHIKQALRHRYYAVNDMVDVSAKMLSHLTNYTTVILGPETSKSKLKGFRTVPISDTQMMMMLVTDKGTTENRLFTVPEGTQLEDLENMISLINKELVGLNLADVFMKLQLEIPELMRQKITQTFDILPILQGLITRMEEERIAVAGKSHLFDYVDVQENKQHIKHLYDMIDNSKDLFELVTPDQDGVGITFGSELQNDTLKGLSVVKTTYHTVQGDGLIALIGPKNMSYDRVVGLMNAMSDELSQSINDYFDEL